MSSISRFSAIVSSSSSAPPLVHASIVLESSPAVSSYGGEPSSASPPRDYPGNPPTPVGDRPVLVERYVTSFTLLHSPSRSSGPASAANAPL